MGNGSGLWGKSKESILTYNHKNTSIVNFFGVYLLFLLLYSLVPEFVFPELTMRSSAFNSRGLES